MVHKRQDKAPTVCNHHEEEVHVRNRNVAVVQDVRTHKSQNHEHEVDVLHGQLLDGQDEVPGRRSDLD
jgi:hypothetical protein